MGSSRSHLTTPFFKGIFFILDDLKIFTKVHHLLLQSMRNTEVAELAWPIVLEIGPYSVQERSQEHPNMVLAQISRRIRIWQSRKTLTAVSTKSDDFDKMAKKGPSLVA